MHCWRSSLKLAHWVLLTVLLTGFVSANEELNRELDLTYSSPLLATRGDAQLTHLELDARIQVIPEVDRAGVVSGPKRLEQLIESQLEIIDFANRAIDAGILEDELVHAQLNMMVNSWLAEQYRDRAFAEQELDDYTDQAREIYMRNPDRFQTESAISFSHILINAADDAEARAQSLLERIQAGETLSALAVANSDDPSVENNQGSFNNIELNMLEAGFKQGVEGMAEGDVGLVESGFGWHVVRIDDVLETGTLPFDAVQEELTEEAKNQHRTQVAERLLRQHYSEPLELEDGAVAKILDRHAPIQR